MSFGRVFAREWLYLLGAIPVSGIIAIMAWFILSPAEPIKRFSRDLEPKHEEDYENIVYWMPGSEIDSLRGKNSSIAPGVPEADTSLAYLCVVWNILDRSESSRDSLKYLLQVQHSWFRVARERYIAAEKAHRQYVEDKWGAIDGAKRVFFVPYPIFLFIKLSIWPIRRVRSKDKVLPKD